MPKSTKGSARRDDHCRAWALENKRWFEEYRAGLSCEDCGSTEDLHFHHLDPSQKSFVVCNNYRTKEARLAEMEKCIVLCASCHKAAHRAMRDWNSLVYWSTNERHGHRADPTQNRRKRCCATRNKAQQDEPM